MFPVINHINDLLPYIKDNKMFRVAEQPNGTTVVCYMLQDEDTFRGEHEDWYKECRGITFDTASGAVVSRTMHKFQNVGENAETQPHMIPWDKITRVMDKRDGSMITFVLLNPGTEHACVRAKTKKTFTSAEAIAATEFLHKDPAMVNWVLKWITNGWTPTFEWTSPKFPIVLLYEKDELTLLQVRNNVTGEYMNLTNGPQFGVHDHELMPFPIVENLIDDFTDTFGGVGEIGDTGFSGHKEVSYHKFRDLQLTKEGVEGWIIQTDDGQMWKLKTKWYCDLHHSVTFTRWRDVARTVLDDKSDDLKAAFAMTGRAIEPIIEVEAKIFKEIERVKARVEELAGLGKGFNRTVKEMALAHMGDEHFRLIMRTFNGQMIDWNEWYLKTYIDGWSLEVIPTVTQNEDNDVEPTE